MRHRHIISALTLLIISSSFSDSNNSIMGYQWGVDIDNIKQDYELFELKNKIIERNIKKWIRADFRKNISIMVSEPKLRRDTTIADISFKPFYGFINNRLVLVWLWSEESKYNKKTLINKRNDLSKHIYGSSEDSLSWAIIKRKNKFDGTISGESAVIGVFQKESKYSELHICIGEFEDPAHIQYMVFDFNVDFFKKYKGFTQDYAKNNIFPYYLFTRSLSEDRIKELKKYHRQ